MRLWLAAVVFFAGWPLGSLGLYFIHALTGGRWGEQIAPGLKQGIAAMPLLIPALVPLAFGLRALYPWADPAHHHFYLSVPFLAVRILLYLAVWLFVRRPVPGLILLVLTANFWTIDTTQSLDPGFNSSVYGLAGLASMTILALAIAILRSGPGETRDLSRLLLGLLIFWGYLQFVQALIVWESDLPKEAAWYLPRVSGAWGIAAWIIFVAHFLVPFLLLLSPAIQSSARNLRRIAMLLVAAQALYWVWIVLPQGTAHG